jgi:hypothetical protein
MAPGRKSFVIASGVSDEAIQALPNRQPKIIPR